MPAPTARPAALLLAGGAGRRMGFDKATLPVGGIPNAARLARLLTAVAFPVLEVGPGRSGLPAVPEEPPRQGPLVALTVGSSALAGMRYQGPVLVVACDLPNLGYDVLALLAGWPGPRSIVPRASGRLQPLCARWSSADLEVATALVSAGERSMNALLQSVQFDELGPPQWPSGTRAGEFADVDTPADLKTFGLLPPLPPDNPAGTFA